MSKQTCARQARRATRKQNHQRRELRKASLREGWLSDNLSQALKALARMQGKEKVTPAEVRALSAAPVTEEAATIS